MTSGHRLGSLSAPPRPQPSFFLEIEGPPPEALLEPLQHSQPLPPQLPQQVVVEEAAPEDLDRTYEYYIKGDDPEVASNAIDVVDAATQWSRLSSRPGSAAASPAPVIGLRISGVVEAIITAAALVHAPRPPRTSASPPPPPIYADSPPWVVGRPPPALLVQRLRTWSMIGDGPLFEPLLSDNRCFW